MISRISQQLNLSNDCTLKWFVKKKLDVTDNHRKQYLEPVDIHTTEMHTDQPERLYLRNSKNNILHN